MMKIKGTVYIVITAILFSIEGRVLLVPWSPMAINSARNIISVIIIGIYLIKTKHKIVVQPLCAFGCALPLCNNDAVCLCK